jgi:hypothetical protein
VERDYYTDFDDAVRSTIGLFLPVLRDLVAVNRFKVRYLSLVWVHDVCSAAPLVHMFTLHASGVVLCTVCYVVHGTYLMMEIHLPGV